MISENKFVPFLLTIDVEPDWGQSGTQAVREVLPKVCEMLEQRGIRATLFVVSDLLSDCRHVLTDAARRHEIASHGASHRILSTLSPADVDKELSESRQRLEQSLQVDVRGFRAPFLRLGTDWFAALARAGYQYDSSIGSVAPSPANRYVTSWQPYQVGPITELPIPSLRTGLLPSSLTYLRLLYPFGRFLLADSTPLLFFHLHELADPRLASDLSFPLSLLLKRGVGKPAWNILDHITKDYASRSKTCHEFIVRQSTSTSGDIAHA